MNGTRNLTLSRHRFLAGLAASLAAWASPVAWLAGGAKAGAATALAEGATFNVRRHGAKGNGLVKDTAAIQKAIDAAGQQGGRVYFPPGRYLCGTLRLRSHVTLEWENGAELVAAPERADFDDYEKLSYNSFSDRETTDFNFALLHGRDLEHVSLVGPGRIDMARTKRGGPKPIALKLCRHILVRDLTIENAPNYNVSLLGCDFVEIEGLTIRNGYCDGIDPDSCRQVRIANCVVESWDDAIVPKASPSLGYLRSTEQVVVMNCVLTTACNGLKLGTESSGGFRDVVMSNCTVRSNPERWGQRRATSGLSLEMVDGGVLERVAVSNLVMRDVRAPVFVRLGNRGRGQAAPTPGRLSDISISDVVATGADLASSITGLPGNPVRRLTLRNLRCTSRSERGAASATADVPELAEKYPDADMFGHLPAYGLYCRHTEGLILDAISLGLEAPDSRPGLILDDVVDADLRTVNAQAPDGDRPAMLLHNVRDTLIAGSRAQHGHGPWARITGAQTARLRFSANDLSAAGQPLQLGSDVPRGSVKQGEQGL